MCQIDLREGTVSLAAIRRVLRELFAKKHGGPFDPPPTSARVKAALEVTLRYSNGLEREEKFSCLGFMLLIVKHDDYTSEANDMVENTD